MARQTVVLRLVSACGMLALASAGHQVPGEDCCHGQDVDNLCYSWFQDNNSCPANTEPRGPCDCYEPHNAMGERDLSPETCCFRACFASDLSPGDCPDGTDFRPDWDWMECEGDCDLDECCIPTCHSTGFDGASCPGGSIPRDSGDFRECYDGVCDVETCCKVNCYSSGFQTADDCAPGRTPRHRNDDHQPMDEYYSEAECCFDSPIPGEDCCDGHDVENLCYSWLQDNSCPANTEPRDQCDCWEPDELSPETCCRRTCFASDLSPGDCPDGTIFAEWNECWGEDCHLDACCIATCHSAGFDETSCPAGTMVRGEHDHHSPGELNTEECCVTTCWTAGYTDDSACPDGQHVRGRGDYHQPAWVYDPTTGESFPGEFTQAECCWGDHHDDDHDDDHGPDVCNFRDLMDALEHAMGMDHHEAMAYLHEEYVIQQCILVGEQVAAASECHGDHHDDYHHDEEPSCLAAGEPMPPWVMAEMEYISERCYQQFAMCFGNGTTFELMGETNPWRQGYCDHRPTGCFEAVNMCGEVDPTDCEGLTQGACMLFTDTAGQAGCAPSPQGNDLAYAAFTCYNEVWPQWNATYDGPREPSP